MTSNQQNAETNDRIVTTEGRWARQFDSANDFAPAELKKKIAICTTPRCGSHFLGHQMYRQGCFGYPLEYLNPGNWKVWDERAQTDDTLDYIKSLRTGPNGVFATKLHHEHLQNFLMQEPNPLSYRFIILQRRDLIEQAVSFARAQQTGAWISDMPERAPAEYDWSLIAEKADAIASGNAGWNVFLRSMGITPLVLYYEDARDDMAGTLIKIAEYLEIDMTALPDIQPAFVPERQKKTTQATWVNRYMHDSRDALAAGGAIPGSAKRPAAGLPRQTLQVARQLLRKTWR